MRIRKHIRKGRREENEGKRKCSRGYVRNQIEQAQKAEHVLFGGRTVGHGTWSRIAARTQEQLALQLGCGWVVEEALEARE